MDLVEIQFDHALRLLSMLPLIHLLLPSLNRMATGQGKVHKNSTTTINEPDTTGNTTDDGHGNANQSAPIELSMHNPLTTLHDVGNNRDDDLPAVVLCDVQAGRLV